MDMKENKLIILLNDKDLISELIKDKDVQVRIKDAVIDGIGRRALKLINVHEDFKSGIKTEIDNTVTRIIHRINENTKENQ